MGQIHYLLQRTSHLWLGIPTPENQLQLILPESEQDKILWEEAEERNKLRKKKRAERKKDFKNEDLDRLNALLAEGRIFCDLPALADRDRTLLFASHNKGTSMVVFLEDF